VNQQKCGETMLAERYILGELPDDARDHFEDHYFGCVECAASVSMLSHLREVVRMEPEGHAERTDAAEKPESFRNGLSTWLPRLWPIRLQSAVVMAALSLAVITGYQNVQLRNRVQPRVLRSVTLQPATRGDLPVLRSGSEGGFVLLEMDLPGAAGPLAWALTGKGQRTVMSGSGDAPEPGLLFKILLPESGLGSDRYTLTVRSAAGQEWQFPFRAEMR
jgi:anti-sigma factor RsiW